MVPSQGQDGCSVALPVAAALRDRGQVISAARPDSLRCLGR